MTDQRSMLEYLASLRQHDCTPLDIGEITIGRTVYSAGSFLQNDRKRIALMPIYRTDWLWTNGVGPTPDLLPASYQRCKNTVYFDSSGLWYISGYNEADGILWLNQVSDKDNFVDNPRFGMSVYWREPFDVSINLASNEVLARIAAQV